MEARLGARVSQAPCNPSALGVRTSWTETHVVLCGDHWSVQSLPCGEVLDRSAGWGHGLDAGRVSEVGRDPTYTREAFDAKSGSMEGRNRRTCGDPETALPMRNTIANAWARVCPRAQKCAQRRTLDKQGSSLALAAKHTAPATTWKVAPPAARAVRMISAGIVNWPAVAVPSTALAVTGPLPLRGETQ